MSFDLQHGLTQYVARRRAPLDTSVTQAVRDALEEGDWLTVLSASGLYAPVAAAAPADRLAWPIVIEPQQPDAQAAGMTVVMGDYSAQTDRYAAVPLFTGYGAGDVPAAARVAPAYAKGLGLVVFGFEPASGGGGAGPLVHGLTTALTSGAEDPFVVAYVERTPGDNNNLLQLVTF
jgi:hypothetical protein